MAIHHHTPLEDFEIWKQEVKVNKKKSAVFTSVFA